MIRWRILAGLITLFSLLCCTRILTNSGGSVQSLDTGKYRTFRIVSPAEGELPGEISPSDYHLIANAIRREMFIRGMVEKGSADLFINIGVTRMLNPTGDGELPSGAYPVFIADRAAYNNTNFFSIKAMGDLLTPGRIAIDIVDFKQQRVLNSLVSELDFSAGALPTTKEEVVTKIIRELFNKINHK